MSARISKDCFPPASVCHNCKRKCRYEVTNAHKYEKEYKRCSGCHLLTYCDKDCQLEHWQTVHKNHCKLLSGKKVVANSEQHEKSCQLCLLQQKSGTAQLASSTSPLSVCHIDSVITTMKSKFGELFGLHAAGKSCNCGTKVACQLPFPLGEVFGQYLDENTGLDLMMAHGLKLLYAMSYKDQGHRNFKTFTRLWVDIVFSRLELWYHFIVDGKVKGENENAQNLSEKVLCLKEICGATNPWWKALELTVSMIESTCLQLRGAFYESRSVQDPRFKTLKLVRDFEQSQAQNKLIVTEKNMWKQFTFWPTCVNGSLEIIFPEGSQCASCQVPLTGPARALGDDDTDRTRPIFVMAVGQNGTLMTWCSILTNPMCLARFYQELCIFRHEKKNYKEELKLFLCETRTCDLCLNYSLFSHRCSGCLAAQYCSTQCQQKDLNFHKTVCSKWAKDKSRKIIGGERQKKFFKSNVVVMD